MIYAYLYKQTGYSISEKMIAFSSSSGKNADSTLELLQP